MSQATWVLIAALLLATAFGLWRTARDGRFRGTHVVKAGQTAHAAAAVNEARIPVAAGTADAAHTAETAGTAGTGGSDQPSESAPTAEPEHPLAALDQPLGERATLLQFSSAFCAPCRTTRRVLADVAELVPGVAHVEVDAEHHLDLVRRLGILRTPTTLVLDAEGREVSRATGAPTKAAVLATLDRALDDPKSV